jgi:pentatricopeptide repeat protein
MGLLNACASVIALEKGRIVHDKIIERGCEFDVFVGNSLVDMYAKLGNTKDTSRMFNKMHLKMWSLGLI